MKRIFKEYFTFTKKERNGIIVLLLIIFLLLSANIYLNNKYSGQIVLTDKEFQKEVVDFEKSLIKIKSTKESYEPEGNTETKVKESEWYIPDSLFEFDPNHITDIKLAKLGFSKYQIKILLKYRKKGGVFYKKEDLLKIYGINKSQFDHLKPYINIENQNKQLSLSKNDAVVESPELISINIASKDELIKLKGIGDAFAERIIKYRDLLGGYYSSDQLLEVFGMDSSRFLGFKDQIIIDTTVIKKIDLNSAGFKTLIKHPYLNKYQTEAILKYRELSGQFKQLNEIIKNNLLEEDTYYRIKPYLKIDSK